MSTIEVVNDIKKEKELLKLFGYSKLETFLHIYEVELNIILFSLLGILIAFFIIFIQFHDRII